MSVDAVQLAGLDQREYGGSAMRLRPTAGDRIRGCRHLRYLLARTARKDLVYLLHDLMLGTLDGDAMHIRTLHGFSDYRRVGRVVLLPLGERLHIPEMPACIAGVEGAAGIARDQRTPCASQHFNGRLQLMRCGTLEVGSERQDWIARQ